MNVMGHGPWYEMVIKVCLLIRDQDCYMYSMYSIARRSGSNSTKHAKQWLAASPFIQG